MTLSTKSKRGGWVGKVFSVQMTLTKKIKIDMWLIIFISKTPLLRPTTINCRLVSSDQLYQKQKKWPFCVGTQKNLIKISFSIFLKAFSSRSLSSFHLYLNMHTTLDCQSSQLARFFAYKTELQNKQYHFKDPQVEIHDVWESVASDSFSNCYD